MTEKEIEKRIEQLENMMWFEEMKDFIDWTTYNAWEKERRELRELLQKGEK